GRRRLAVSTGDADDLVRRKVAAGLGEQLDVADQRHTGGTRLVGDRMGVERHARRQHHAVEPGEVDRQRVGDRHPTGELVARALAAIPRGHLGAARQQRLDSGHARPGQAEHRVALSGKGARDDHRSFSVARPSTARTMAMIQKRITTVDSFQPSCSKWWWIGAMRKIRLPVRLNQKTWMITLAVSMTNSPPMMNSTISWCAATAIAPS